MSDTTHEQPKPKSAARQYWDELSNDTKSIYGLVVFLGLAFATAKGCGAIVSAKDLETHAKEQRTALATHAKEEEAARDAIDDDVDLLHQTTVRLSTQSEGILRELDGVRRDLRRMDRGEPLAPLPSPRPSPRVTP